MIHGFRIEFFELYFMLGLFALASFAMLAYLMVYLKTFLGWLRASKLPKKLPSGEQPAPSSWPDAKNFFVQINDTAELHEFRWDYPKLHANNKQYDVVRANRDKENPFTAELTTGTKIKFFLKT